MKNIALNYLILSLVLMVMSCAKNENDEVITDPKYMTIKSLVVKNISLTNSGTSWDAESDNSGADVIITIEGLGTGNFIQKSSTFYNNNSTILNYTLNPVGKITKEKGVQISIYDNDDIPGSEEYMSSTEILFWYSDLKSKSFPKTVIITGDNGFLAELVVEYSNN